MQDICTIKIKNILPIHFVSLQMTEGERIRKVRGNMKYGEFAEPLGVGGSNISNIEKGRSGLSIELAKKIATVYDVSLDWLLLGKEILEEPQAAYNSSSIMIDKDELIELQRLALKNTKKALEAHQQAEQKSKEAKEGIKNT